MVRDGSYTCVESSTTHRVVESLYIHLKLMKHDVPTTLRFKKVKIKGKKGHLSHMLYNINWQFRWLHCNIQMPFTAQTPSNFVAFIMYFPLHTGNSCTFFFMVYISLTFSITNISSL